MSRDLDGQFSEREQAAVQEWLQSNKAFHITRDHPAHKFPIPGGCWGCKLITNIARKKWESIWNMGFDDKIMWKSRGEYLFDQTFLER